MNKDIPLLKALFEEKYCCTPSVTGITGGGSDRRYFRLTDSHNTVVGCVCDDAEENRCFIALDKCFLSNGIKVPEIYSVSKDGKAYLMEDLGDIDLLKLLDSPDKMELAEKSIRQLVKLQAIPESQWEGLVRYSPLSQRLVKWDLNYFKYDFLKPAGIPFDEEQLENDFERIEENIARIPASLSGFMYRDFQSRNIMVKEGDLYFIDFQGGRKGPIIYDIISFLWQAKAQFSYQERETLADLYVSLTSESKGITPEEIKKGLPVMILFRNLQVLGAYGLRGLIERKSHFLESIPLAVANLSYQNDSGSLDEYPELRRIAERLKTSYGIKPALKENALTVTVLSFSYKKGYPADNSGNGGGFMFDCRGLDNPGRYDEYKHLTGLDTEVIEFLSEREETSRFIENAFSIVKPSVERYHSRGFTSLQVGFGCTGGRHRSVYCAENFAKKIRENFGDDIKIKVVHREQGIEKMI